MTVTIDLEYILYQHWQCSCNKDRTCFFSHIYFILVGDALEMRKKEYVDVFLVINMVLSQRELQIPECNIPFLFKHGFQKLLDQNLMTVGFTTIPKMLRLELYPT